MIKVLFFKLLLKRVLFFSAAVLISMMGLVGLDFTTYKQLTAQEAILKVKVNYLETGYYLVQLKSEDFEREFKLEGDQWQIDFRLIRFSPLVSLTGLSYLYQPSRISNRYASIEDQRNKTLHFYSLRDSQAMTPDLWDYFKNYSDILPMIDTTFGSSVFMPLEENAEYEILIGFSGLVVKAANEEGRLAVQQWL